MKKLLTIVFSLLTFTQLFAQGVSKNSKGEGAVLFKGNNIALDIGETEVSFGVNNLPSSIGKNSSFVWGGNLKAKNASGIGGLFSTGDFIPSSTLSGFAGYSFSNGIPDGLKVLYTKKLGTLKSYMEEADESLTESITNSIKSELETTALDSLKEALLEKQSTSRTQEQFINYVGELAKKKDFNALKPLYDSLKKLIDGYATEKKKKEEEIKEIQDALSITTYNQTILFGFGGISSSEFKYLKGIDPVTLSNSFSDQYFRGGHFGIGLNHQFGRFMIGATYNYRQTHNFDLLSKKDYTLRTSQTSGNQSLVEEKKIAAYSGTYGNVGINEFAFDFLWHEKLDSDGKNSLLINPYIKSNFFSRNKELLPNSTNIGTGLYFFQQSGKFLGGIYVELPDINQNYEKAKPVLEQNFRKPLQRLSFGITGRFSIGSIVNLF